MVTQGPRDSGVGGLIVSGRSSLFHFCDDEHNPLQALGRTIDALRYSSLTSLLGIATTEATAE